MPTSSRTRRALAGGAVAVSLGLGGLTVAALNPLGIVSAQEDDGSTSSTESTTTLPPSGDETPPPPGEDPAPPGGEQGGRHRGPGFLDEVLDALVEDGTLTQEQADAVRDGVKAKVDEWREEHPGRPGGHHGRGWPGLRQAFETAAEVIGVEPDALREGLREGKSIAQIAEENDVSRQEVIDAIVDKATEVIDQKVADGDLDAERAEQLKADLPDIVARVVDATSPFGPR